MKKIYLFFTLLVTLSSCSEDNAFSTNDDLSRVTPSTRTSGDGKYEVVGYGYDITDVYLGANSTKKQVIDVEAFQKGKDGHRYTTELIAQTLQREFYGATAIDYVNEIINSSNYNGSIAYGSTVSAETKSTPEKPKTGASFSGSVAKDKADKFSYSSKYSFGRGDYLKKQRQYTIDRKPNELYNYLGKSFKEDVFLLTADDLVIKYGTHVLLDITVGGMYIATYKSAIVETSSIQTKTLAVKSGLNLSYQGVGVNFGSSSSTTEMNFQNTKNTDWRCTIESWGGYTNGVSTTISATEPPKLTFNVGAWTQSVDDTHSKLIDINWNATYPIYDFISDPIKKAQIKAAVERYIKSKQLDVLDVEPLHRWWHAGNRNTLLTIMPKDQFPSSGWSYEGVQGFVCKKKEPGTVELHRWWHAGNKNTLLTTMPKDQFPSKGWVYEGVQGYVYTTQVSSTVPLHRWWHAGNKNTLLTTMPKDQFPSKGWTYEGVQGYVYTPEDSNKK